MANSDTESEKLPHIQTQRQYFDQRADIFRAPVPSSIQDRTRKIVESAGLGPQTRVLDVGTGAGVLIAHFLEFGVEPGNIVGIDLSQEMLRTAKSRNPGVFFYQTDIAELRLPLPEDFPDGLSRVRKREETSGQADLTSLRKRNENNLVKCFDVVFFSACFGNMWNQQEALMAATDLLDRSGRIVISHPLGARFVDSLHQNEPHIVPHQLPNHEQLEALCSESGLSVVSSDIRDEFYLVILRKN